ncbi:MAG: hypothetical protein KDD82_05995 [Planctomycetes bacterium]|nr:hypothetical protein [Planctomycetota bacterium]
MAILIVLLLGCATGDPAHDHPDADPEPARAPALEPPPAARRRLSPEDVLAIARAAEDPGAAVRELDRYPFAFELTQERQGWFAQQGIPGEVADYLEKRAEVDWEALRGDVDPATPAAGR